MTHWVGYGFHFTELANVPGILRQNTLYSRSDAVQQGLIAAEVGDPEILGQTTANVLECVRFYWRPHTPMLFQIEGIRAAAQYRYQAQCQIPVFFIVPLHDLLQRSDIRFTDRNAASSYHVEDTSHAFIQTVPFEKVFHDGPLSSDNKEEIISRRQAEILIPHQFALTSNTYILVRSPAETLMLQQLLDPAIWTAWRDRIITSNNVPTPAYFKFWLFVEEIFHLTNTISIKWNPPRQPVGPVNIHIRWKDLESGKSGEGCLPWTGNRMGGIKNVRNVPYFISIQIDQARAFEGKISPS